LLNRHVADEGLIALERELGERAAIGVKETFRVEDFGNVVLRAAEYDADAKVEFADTGLDARVEEGGGKEDLILLGENSNLLGHLLAPS